MTESFAAKVVVVTGAGRGIGRAIAEAFAGAGASVVLGARTLSYADEAVAGIVAAGGAASSFQLDVKDRAGVFGLVDAAVERYGRLDVVVHSAAEIPHGNVLQVKDEDIDNGFASITKAAFWLAQASSSHLSRAEHGGRLIFISSVCGPQTVLPGRIAYGVAKSGLDAFIRGAALDLARDNITVNGIEPGLIASDRALEVVGREGMASFGNTLPVPRPGTPEEVAHVALFLASRHSGYITGASIVIDGGSTLSSGDTSGLVKQH